MTVTRVDPTVPVIATNWQASLRGLLMGTNTPYTWRKVEGLGLPATVDSDADRAGTDGSFGGADLAAKRFITAELLIIPRVGDPSLDVLIANLKAAWARTSDDIALALRIPNIGPVVYFGRPRRCDTDYDVLTSSNKRAEAAVQFVALDPLQYAAALGDVVIGYGTAGTNAGFTFNRATGGAGLAFNRATPAATPGAASDAAAGGAGAAGFQQLTNGGAESTNPVTRVVAAGGPVTGPIHLERVESGEDLVLDYSLSINDVLELDHNLHSVTLNGANRSDIVDLLSQWWVLQPGVNTIHYRSEGPGAGSYAEVFWRNASW